MTLRVMIGTGLAGSFVPTDYGPSPYGDNSLQDITLRPAGAGQVGECSLRLRKSPGASIVIKPRMQVYIGDWNGTAWTKRYFGGFVKSTKATAIKGGSNARIITVECADLNLLADWLRMRVNLGGASDGGTYDFKSQLLDLCRLVTYNSHITGPTFDATTGVALSGTLTGTKKTYFYEGNTLHEMLDDRMLAYQQTFPSTRPKWDFGLDQTSSATFNSTSVILNVWDEALIASETVAYSFSTETTGDVYDYTRDIDGIDLQTGVQSFRNGTSGRYTATYDSTNRTAYPNDFDQRNIGGSARLEWEGPARKLNDNVDTTLVDADNAAAGATKENPRETLSLTTKKAATGSDPTGTPIMPRPGQVITFTCANETLTAQRYRVQQVTTHWTPRPGGNNWWPTHNLVCGNKWLEMGQVETPSSPVSYPASRLDPPVIPAGDPTQYYDGKTGYVNFSKVFTPSGSNAVSGYTALVTDNVQQYEVQIAGRTSNTVKARVRPKSACTLVIYARDAQGHYSDASNTLSWTSIGSPPHDTLYNSSFQYVDPSDTTQPDGWTLTATGGATGALTNSSSNVLKGNQSYQILAAGGQNARLVSDKIAILGNIPAPNDTQLQMWARTLFKQGVSGGTTTLEADWYDDTNAFISTTVMATYSGATAGQTILLEPSAPVSVPATATSVQLAVKSVGTGVAQTSYIFAGVEWELVTPGSKLSAQTILPSATQIQGGGGTAVLDGTKGMMAIGQNVAGGSATEIPFYEADGVTKMADLFAYDDGVAADRKVYLYASNGGIYLQTAGTSHPITLVSQRESILLSQGNQQGSAGNPVAEVRADQAYLTGTPVFKVSSGAAGINNLFEIFADGKITPFVPSSAGDMIYADGNGVPTRLVHGSAGQILQMVSGTPAWANIGTTLVQTGTFASIPAANTVPAGTLYFPTDSIYNVLRSDGTNWHYFKDGFETAPPDTLTFSWDNQGSATVDTTRGGVFITSTTTTYANSLRVRYKTKAYATPYSLIGVFSRMGAINHSAQSGILFRESATGKIMTCAMTQNGNFSVDKWTNSTTFSVNAKTDGLGLGLTWGSWWYRIRDDGTKIYFDYSSDFGRTWLNRYSESRTTFFTLAPDQVGIFSNDANSGTPETIWCWHYQELNS